MRTAASIFLAIQLCGCASSTSLLPTALAALPLISVNDLRENAAKYDGTIVKVRGLVSGADGEAFLLDVGNENCAPTGPPALLIDLRPQFQNLVGAERERVVVLVGRFHDELYPVRDEPVTRRAIGNDFYIGPIAEPKVLSSSDDCGEFVRTWSHPRQD